MNRGLTGAILTGGSATRLDGAAKGLLEVGGHRIIDRVAATLAPLVDETVIVSRKYGPAWITGTRVITDVLTGGGSAAGLHAALRAVQGPVLVVAWDMPFLSSGLLSLIVGKSRRGEDGTTSGFDIVVPAGAEVGELEPLCAWYAPSCAAAIEREWDSGDRSLHGLCGRLRTLVVPREEILACGAPERLFFNVNSSADLSTARAMAHDDGARRTS